VSNIAPKEYKEPARQPTPKGACCFCLSIFAVCSARGLKFGAELFSKAEHINAEGNAKGFDRKTKISFFPSDFSFILLSF
jgi:hypothetical protein